MRRDVLVAVAAAAVFAALTAGLAAGGALIELDLAVREWAEAHRPDAAELVPRILNRLGQGGALLGICVALAGWLGLRRLRRGAGWWPVLRPLLYVATATVLVYVMVAVPKAITDRGAPSSPWSPEQAVRLMGPQPAGEYAKAYPSGHAVNMIVWYGVLLVLVTALLHAYGRLPPRGVATARTEGKGRQDSGPGPARARLAPRGVATGRSDGKRVGGVGGDPARSRPGLPPVPWWALRVVPAALVVGSQTYLSFHWLTDSLAGLSLGLVIDRILHLLHPQARIDMGETGAGLPDSGVRLP